MQRLRGNFSLALTLLVSLALATACGGTTQRAPETDSAGQASGGGAGAATAGEPSGEPAGTSGMVGNAGGMVGSAGGMVGSTGGKPPASAGSPNAPAACMTGILPEALEGCRAPNEPGCATCYVERPDGSCEAYSGSARRDDYFVYTMLIVKDDGCENGPRCASCLRETEAALCEERGHPECDCREPPGVDPCFNPDGCGCFCSVGGQNRRACPPAG